MDELAAGELDIGAVSRSAGATRCASSRTRTRPGSCFESGQFFLQSLELLGEQAIDLGSNTQAESDELAGRARKAACEGSASPGRRGAHGLWDRSRWAAGEMEMTLGYDTAWMRVEPDGSVRLALGASQPRPGPPDDHGADRGRRARHSGRPDPRHLRRHAPAVRKGHVGKAGHRRRRRRNGSREVRARSQAIAAEMLEADPGRPGAPRLRGPVRGNPSSGVSFAQIARRAKFAPRMMPAGVDPGWSRTARYHPPGGSRAAATACWSRWTRRPGKIGSALRRRRGLRDDDQPDDRGGPGIWRRRVGISAALLEHSRTTTTVRS